MQSTIQINVVFTWLFVIRFVDGVQKYRIDNPSQIPHEPMYLIMNVAVGGWYVNAYFKLNSRIFNN